MASRSRAKSAPSPSSAGSDQPATVDAAASIPPALPVGTVAEHEALNRWRVHLAASNRVGHGPTLDAALHAFTTGADLVSVEDAAAQRLAALHPAVRQDIADRDQAAAMRGSAPVAIDAITAKAPVARTPRKTGKAAKAAKAGPA